ncbi:MAG: translation initiation factor IF-2 subunit gamma [Candidatus Methanomethylicota archaeon]|uniref:protein-synthesizing GTPase n=1 Tax=Thermoproteota archaeon TaxID=2056631 RepID=A0A497EK84_9CREN|nr:MAG: translation initiation factor IF-2 subunit gamma [Candidatus Verstraetearchaeota archaeon]
MGSKSEVKEGVFNLPELNVGVIGHIDHGKTTLLKSLTGKFTDTHSEELKRGITIKLGYASVVIYNKNGKFNIKEGKPQRYVSFIDAPGHEMLMATMLSGASIIDAAILVIAANEGIKPQTREHFMALQVKGVKNLIVVQNKIDLVSKEQTLKNYEEIKGFLKGTFAENAPIIPVSAQQGVNVDKVLEYLCKIEIPSRDEKGDPIFLVARSFDVNRPGKSIEDLNGGVLGGILKKGRLKVEDEIEIKPGLSIRKSGKVHYQPLVTRILSLYKGDFSVKEVRPGASISIETSLDPCMAKTDSLTGCIVSKKGILPPISESIRLRASFFDRVFGVEENKGVTPPKVGETFMLNVNTTTTLGRISKISGNDLDLELSIPVVALKGDKVGIARNFNHHWRLIGWGEVL